MNALSPNLLKSGQVNFTVKADGKAIPDTIGVVSIETWSSVNKVPHAKLVIYDGSAAKQNFEIANTNIFLPGVKIDLSVGYAGKSETTIFSGLIVRQSIEINNEQAPRLCLHLYDEAMRMTLDRKNAIFENIKDSDLIGKLISTNKLKKKKVGATKTTHEEIVQYYATDWDLMLMRAEANGMIVVASGGAIVVEVPDTDSKPALTVTFGDSILDFHAEMNAATQLSPSAVESVSWDPDQQKIISKKAGTVKVTEPGNVSSAELAKVFGIKKFPQQTGAPIELTDLAAWSDAEILKSKLSKIQGTVSFQGSAEVVTGKTIELAGVGERYNGSAYVSGVHHNVNNGRWVSTVEFGLSARWFAAEASNIVAPDASGLLPAIKGLQTAIVKKVAKDPAGEFRVEVELPLLQTPGKSLWARLAGFYASNKVGAVFYPEVGDEVIVGFMNEDPRFPVILGSAYSKKNPPPFAPDEKNDKKTIVSRSKLEISFDEKDKILEIKTPGKHLVRLDDKAGKVTISDSNKNIITLAKNGVTIDSGSNMVLKSKGNMTLQAGGNLKLTAKANANVEALQIINKAKAKFSATGAGTAELKSSGIVTVRGTLVKLN